MYMLLFVFCSFLPVIKYPPFVDAHTENYVTTLTGIEVDIVDTLAELFNFR